MNERKAVTIHYSHSHSYDESLQKDDGSAHWGCCSRCAAAEGSGERTAMSLRPKKEVAWWSRMRW